MSRVCLDRFGKTTGPRLTDIGGYTGGGLGGRSSFPPKNDCQIITILYCTVKIIFKKKNLLV